MLDPENKSEDIESLKAKLTQAENSRDEYLAGWQRAKADFINYKKEELHRLEEIAKYGTEELILELITILDNFDLALEYFKKGPAPTQESEFRPEGVGMDKGVYMIRTQISDILKKRGLIAIPMKVGDKFNPSLSEAVSEQESDRPPGTVLEVIETGYKLHDKILRPARVKVSK